MVPRYRRSLSPVREGTACALSALRVVEPPYHVNGRDNQLAPIDM